MKIEALAKINLTLEVFGLRADGYHALRSVVMPVTLADSLEIEDALSLTSDTGYSDDLCIKAAKVLDPSRGAKIKVAKRIPVGGGLGGGSADAAATMIALNDIWGLMHSREELVELAAQVGSDVPSLVYGGAVVMEGRGEKVRPLDPVKPFDLVLVNPKVHSVTAEVYRQCAPRKAADSLVLGNMLAALASGSIARIGAALSNDLIAPAIALYPEIAEVLEFLRKSELTMGASMSGSGSTVFAVVADAVSARFLAEKCRERGFEAWAVKSAGVAGVGD